MCPKTDPKFTADDRWPKFREKKKRTISSFRKKGSRPEERTFLAKAVFESKKSVSSYIKKTIHDFSIDFGLSMPNWYSDDAKMAFVGSYVDEGGDEHFFYGPSFGIHYGPEMFTDYATKSAVFADYSLEEVVLKHEKDEDSPHTVEFYHVPPDVLTSHSTYLDETGRDGHLTAGVYLAFLAGMVGRRLEARRHHDFAGYDAGIDLVFRIMYGVAESRRKGRDVVEVDKDVFPDWVVDLMRTSTGVDYLFFFNIPDGMRPV